MADLLELGVLFAAIALVGWLSERLGQSVIPFYIVVGMALSEFVIGRVDIPVGGELYIAESEFIELGAELGIIFLLFFLGLEFNLSRLFARWKQIGTAGGIDFLINFGVGFALGWLFFSAFVPAFLVAGIVYISSSAIITKSLIDLGWIANDEADPMLGTLVCEDLIIAVYLAVASALVLGGGGIAEAATSIGIGIGFILLLLLAVYVGTAWLNRVLATGSNEFIVLRAVGITVLVAGAALSLGVSEAVAAFFVGMAFSETDHVHDLESLLEPLRDTFAAVFFFWIGLITDPLLFTGVVTFIGIAVLLTTPTKLLSGFLGGRVFNLSTRRSMRVGLGMTTRGEFSLIIAALALSGAGGTLAPELANTINAFAVGYVLVMAIIGTSLMQYSVPFENIAVRYLDRPTAEEAAG